LASSSNKKEWQMVRQAHGERRDVVADLISSNQQQHLFSHHELASPSAILFYFTPGGFSLY
jgi:hypothetical protein